MFWLFTATYLRYKCTFVRHSILWWTVLVAWWYTQKAFFIFRNKNGSSKTPQYYVRSRWIKWITLYNISHAKPSDIYTGYTKKNGAVSKVNKKFISHLTRAQRTDLWLQCSMSFVHGLEKAHHAWCVFSKPCTKLTVHCNHRSGHLKTEHTESLFLLRRHLGNWPRGPAVSMRSELLVAHEKLGQLPLLTVYVVPV